MTETYTLPDLPYAYDALEPWCDAETMHLHHDKHHAAYVKGANAATEELAALDPADASRRAGATAALTFNLGGHVLHSLFWENLTPNAAPPPRAMLDRLARDFGSFDRFRALFAATCTGVQGSGWGAIVHDPIADRLQVAALHDHHRDLVPGGSILAVVDVWEHAYYLTHHNDRAAWVAAALEHLDWTVVAVRLERTATMARR